MYVYISHASQDADLVEKNIRNPLRQFGLIPEVNRSPTTQEEERQLLQTCRWFVIALTPHSVAAPHVAQQLQWIRENRPDVRVLPVVAAPCSPDSLDTSLGSLQQIDITKNGAGAIRLLIYNCVGDLMSQFHSLRGQIQQMGQSVAQLTQQNMELERQNKQFATQLDNVTRFDGEPWESLVDNVDQHYVPREQRSARVIAVANIKGGVGKTTITQNLGATLWSLGKRVLLIDLDHQGSLSRRCLKRAQFEQMAATSNLITKLFVDNPALVELPSWSTPIEGSGSIIGADETLHLAEERLKVRWLAGMTEGDIRFRLADALAESGAMNQFDYILFDCPPRLTSAYINGIAAADFLLIPVVVDQMSIEGLPRQLGWLRRMSDRRIMPHTQLLGIVANRSGNSQGLTQRELQLWNSLPANYEQAWGGEVYCFATNIFPTVRFSDALSKSEFPAFDTELKPHFQKLAHEVIARIDAT